MPEVKFNKEPEDNRLESGDLIVAGNTNLWLVWYQEDQNYLLVDAESMDVVATVNHPAHAINHVKKHYGEFKFIKGDRITVEVN